MTWPDSRRAGVSLHISSLPGRFGIGELGSEAFCFIDAMVRLGITVWQILPIGPTGYGNSPYQPLSTFAGNEMLIDIGKLVDMGLLEESEIECLVDLRSDYVDFERLIPLKTEILDRAAGRFEERADSVSRQAFAEFVEHNDTDWLHDYAQYRLLKTKHNERPWPEWEKKYVDRDDDALRLLGNTEQQGIRRLKVIQFFFRSQWQELHSYAQASGVVIFGDMPIYIAFDSADAWANRELLCRDSRGWPQEVAGVPPDYFSQDGQLWGNPLYDWDFHARTQYAWWIDRMRAIVELHDLVRIDHFRGFESYWAVKADADTARNGTWQKGPGDALFEALRLELARIPIVAEDLGMITPEVISLRERHGIPGMAVLQFKVDEIGFEAATIADNCVCYTGTHDNDTTVGWFCGSPGENRSTEDIEKRQNAVLKLTHGSASTIHHDLIRMAFSTNARIAIAPLQDFLGLGSEARLNTPGTTFGNWQWRTNRQHLASEPLEMVASIVRNTSRYCRGQTRSDSVA